MSQSNDQTLLPNVKDSSDSTNGTTSTNAMAPANNSFAKKAAVRRANRKTKEPQSVEAVISEIDSGDHQEDSVPSTRPGAVAVPGTNLPRSPILDLHSPLDQGEETRNEDSNSSFVTGQLIDSHDQMLVDAEVIPQSKEKTCRRPLTWTCFLLSLMLIGGLVAFVKAPREKAAVSGASSLSSEGQQSPSSSPSDSLSSSPSGSPSWSPTHSSIPSFAPTTSPAPSSSPTPNPTISPEQMLQWLEPTIIRTENDRPVFDNPISPQARALRWLSADGISKIGYNSSLATVLERYVLAVFYYSTGGSFWWNSVSFLTDSDVCQWNDEKLARGVGCNTNTNIEKILLFENGLEGTIPWELSLLLDLRFLAVRKNSLIGTIPTALGDRMTHLDLSNNDLDGTLPTELGQWSQLERLNVEDNNVKGTIPTDFGLLMNLNHFYASRNALTGTIPTELGQLTQLEWLDISSNALNGTIPTELGLLSTLITLNVSSNFLTGSVPQSLAHLIVTDGQSDSNKFSNMTT